MAGKDPDGPASDEQARYWRHREWLDKIKLILWLVFEVARDSGLGPRDFRI